MSAPSLAARPFLSPERLAVSLMFLANGFLVGSWAPKIPEFALRLDLDESALGLMIMCFGIGSLCAMPLVGLLISRSGSRMPVLWLAAMTVTSLPLVTLAPSIWTAAIALFLFGGVIGGMDVAMNANAVEVEKRLDRAIMSSCHGFWSLGGVIGATFGGVLIAYFRCHVTCPAGVPSGLCRARTGIGAALWLIGRGQPLDHASAGTRRTSRPGLLTRRRHGLVDPASSADH